MFSDRMVFRPTLRLLVMFAYFLNVIAFAILWIINKRIGPLIVEKGREMRWLRCVLPSGESQRIRPQTRRINVKRPLTDSARVADGKNGTDRLTDTKPRHILRSLSIQ